MIAPGLQKLKLLLQQVELALLRQNDGVKLGHLPLQVRKEQLEVGQAIGFVHRARSNKVRQAGMGKPTSLP